ncbi:MAG TPA: imidazole glycerol phosphate synthase subunit HisH [Candidatus Omnitrophota bacterium]|nr:imidazole glycerol phosphate synthase subunit HisH [Candidatus Omnitrophota bacterium]HPD84103.1 imidazole glycerol phosphate synthase subunit HisH [Candidatus Omnitrophota bacterium]HRZ02960.1 imidazole glycerol phosphate synthase subunit HisH [Candidatus Omnitrophota bacterium]
MHGKVAIIDYGVGNVHSVACALSFLGYRNMTTRDPKIIRQADALILPGVGAFGQAMANLKKFDLLELLNGEVLRKGKPILGICLGMQILGNSSEESPGHKGLGWIDFDVVSIPQSPQLKVPHVGWNTLRVENQKDLFTGLEEEPHFYFDHSYYADCSNGYTVARCHYGAMMPAVVVKGNITGVQFHPEKSQRNGLKLFRNYFNHLGV